MASESPNPARQQNENIALKRERQAASSDVFSPCLKTYQSGLPASLPTSEPDLAIAFLGNLTNPLWASYPAILKSISKRMAKKWKDRPPKEKAAKVAASIANSKKRSAGTNFQALVSYALARYLIATDSSWYIHFPVPKEFREAMAITFTAGIPPQPQELAVASEASTEVESEASAEAEPEASTEPVSDNLARVQPDVDMLLRNSNWRPTAGTREPREPIILLSVKTSIIDRGGSAARWKMYFDLANNPCPLSAESGCAYRRLGIQMGNANLYDIRHGIVTANIYSMGNVDLDREGGELNNQQTRSNTYMFSLKLTTRNDDKAKTPEDWKQFEYIAEYLANVSAEFNSPASSDSSRNTAISMTRRRKK